MAAMICSCNLAEVRIHEVFLTSRRRVAARRNDFVRAAQRWGRKTARSGRKCFFPGKYSDTAGQTSAQNVTPGAAPLRVMVGKSLLINTTERLRRVSVTYPGVADAIVVTPTQVLVNGLAPGEVSLLIWDELERSRSFDLRVDVDITAASEEMHPLFPDEQINVTPSRNAIVLSGHVTTEEAAKHAGALATAYSKNVVNVLTFGPVGAEEVLLEVRFAEVDRTALTQLGINFFSTGAGNSISGITTGQFGGTHATNLRTRLAVPIRPTPRQPRCKTC